MKFRPARSSAPSAGATGVVVRQHDAYMIADGSGLWPSPIVWPTSCSSTRLKSCGARNEDPRSAAFWKTTYPLVNRLNVDPLTVPPSPKEANPPPNASVGLLISSLGSSNEMTTLPPAAACAYGSV